MAFSLQGKITSLFVVSLVAMTPLAMAEDAASSPLRAGAATANVTPWLGLSISGSMRDITAAYIHDELHARCLVLESGATRVAVALVDNCMVPREVTDGAKHRIEERLGIPPSHVLIAATHTHSGPCATPVFQSEPDEEYQQFLVKRIADGVEQAVGHLAPAEVAWGGVDLPEEVFNRRWHVGPELSPPNPFGAGPDKVWMNPPRAHKGLIEPAGPTDPEIAVLSVRALDGRPIAVLANYSLHYIGGVGAGHISADYFGVFARELTSRLNAHHQSPPFVGILSNGTSGDINNIDFSKPAEARAAYEQMNAVGTRVADKVATLMASFVYTSALPLDAAYGDLELGVRKPGEQEVMAAQVRLDEAGDGPLSGLEDIYARETVLLDAYPDEVSIPLQVLAIGPLGIYAVPCEVFVEIGLELKESTPFAKAFTIELANGYFGYLPTARHHELGGYETWRARSSFLEVDAASKIVTRLKELAAGLTATDEDLFPPRKH